ncbi:MAG: glycosyltransferase family 39 protein [Thermoleophilales bacterium]|nr:glycosyltransferase family 39 protein [Thermoleophilales bacterium]
MDTSATPTTAPIGETREPGRLRNGASRAVRALARVRPEVWALIALSAILNLWAIDQNGWANEYYSAAVKSMSASWHNFLFNSFDSAGVMTLDKPPLAFWVQALSVRVFGFSSAAILIPQALMGVASTVLVYDLTRRVFGRVAGSVAGFVFILTPITVAIFRHNNPDALLTLLSVAALWFVIRGFEDGRTRWLLLAGLMVGLGFETKMSAALMLLPALAIAWLWVAPGGSRLRALWQLLAAGGVMLVAALAWPVLVWLTPEGSRPWVSGTSDNSIWSLITNYNGVGRVAGQAGGPGGMAGGPGGMGGGGGVSVFGGDTGLFRLIGSTLGGQIGWMLGLSVAGGALVAVQSRFRRKDPRTGWVIATGGIFLTIAIVFSFASGIFHPYYVAQLAPFAAALCGAAVAALVSLKGNLRPLVIPAIAVAVVAETVVIFNTDSGYGWLVPILIGAGIAAAVILARFDEQRLRTIAACGLTAVLMVVPAIWSVETLGHATSGTFPAGGPASQSMGGGPGGMGGGPGGMSGGPGGMSGSSGGMGMPGQSGSSGSSSQSFPTPPSGMSLPSGMTPPSGAMGMAPPGMGFPGQSGSSSNQSGFPGMTGGPGGMGGPGGEDLSSAIATAKANGGGNVAVSGQQTASGSIIEGTGSSDVNVVALGGFSGRESEVDVSWLSERVADGDIRWVLASDTGTSPADGRVGSSELMAAVTEVCEPVQMESTGAGSSSDTGSSSDSNVIYDCAGKASALAAQ